MDEANRSVASYFLPSYTSSSCWTCRNPCHSMENRLEKREHKRKPIDHYLSHLRYEPSSNTFDSYPCFTSRLVTNQVGEDDLNFKDAKEEEKVSFVEEEQYVIERYDETSLSTLTHIIVKEVHRKARVGVRELRHSLCHGKRKFQEVSNSTNLVNVTSKKPREKHLSQFHIEDILSHRAVVRLPNLKLKTLGERGIEGIFVRYAEHSKAFRFYVIEPKEPVSINSINESKDAIFNENRFYSVPRLSLRIPNRTGDIGGSVVPEEVTKEVVTQQLEPELRKSKRNRTPKNFGSEFQLYLIEGTRDEVSNQHSYCFNVEDDPKTFDEAMKSQDVAFWKEAINDEMDFIMGKNTWVLANLPPGCKPLGCKWIFKIKLKVDGTIEKFKARLMSVKTEFLNGELDEEAPKQWHQKFDEVVLSIGYLLKQANKCVYRKFDESGKGVIICLYVDDMLIFGTDQVQVDLTKEFLSLIFSMKDMKDADVILALASNSKGTEASNKQTCITSSTIESEFLALAAAGKEAEWLKNLIFEIPLWSKPIAPISIFCDSVATLAKAYSQMYNEKSNT
ncbi:zinc finger, CCHC-type containing protein [Tanacetum coccineum]